MKLIKIKPFIDSDRLSGLLEPDKFYNDFSPDDLDYPTWRRQIREEVRRFTTKLLRKSL